MQDFTGCNNFTWNYFCGKSNFWNNHKENNFYLKNFSFSMSLLMVMLFMKVRTSRKGFLYNCKQNKRSCINHWLTWYNFTTTVTYSKEAHTTNVCCWCMEQQSDYIIIIIIPKHYNGLKLPQLSKKDTDNKEKSKFLSSNFGKIKTFLTESYQFVWCHTVHQQPWFTVTKTFVGLIWFSWTPYKTWEKNTLPSPTKVLNWLDIKL